MSEYSYEENQDLIWTIPHSDNNEENKTCMDWDLNKTNFTYWPKEEL